VHLAKTFEWFVSLYSVKDFKIKEQQRNRKRSSPPNDENSKPANSSPSKLLSPIHSIKRLLWSPQKETQEEEETTTNLSVKKPRRDHEPQNGFITSSPLVKQKSKAAVTSETLTSPKKTSRNLNSEFESIVKPDTNGSEPDSPASSSQLSQDDSSDESRKKKSSTLLNTLFSPMFTFFNGPPKQNGGSSRTSPATKNDLLSSDETLNEIPLLSTRDSP
jgi:hypothetical protein